MAALNPPSSTSVVNVPDSFVERYEAAGWTRAEQEKKQAPRRRKADDGDKK